MTATDAAPADEASPTTVTRRRGNPVRWTVLCVGVFVVLVLGVIVGQRITDDAARFDSPLLGRAAPEFELPRIVGGSGTLASWRLRGRVTVVNFWATWCVPCRRENAVLDDFYQRWEPRGVELVGILYSDSVPAAQRFRDEVGGSWPLVDDADGRTSTAFGITGVPETFIIDEDGIVVAALVGAVGPATLDEILAELAAGAGTATYNNLDDNRQRPEPTE